MEVHNESKQYTNLHEYVSAYSSSNKFKKESSDGPVDEALKRWIGGRVRVQKYGDGWLRFYGPHKVRLISQTEKQLN